MISSTRLMNWKELRMRNSCIKVIEEASRFNNDIILMTGDLGYGVLNNYSRLFPEQYINAGIAEENMTSVAAGLALEGKCVFTYSIGNFCTLRCMEQIRNDICYHNANVKIISLAAGFAYGNLGMSHHATEDIACMRSLPNMTVFSPCDPLEAVAVTNAALKIKGPCFIRLGRGGEPCLRESFNLDDFVVGKGYGIIENGKDIVIFTTGSIAIEAKKAAEYLNGNGYHVSLYTFPTIKPLSKEFVLNCLNDNSFVITVEEHQINGGFGGAIAEILAESGCKVTLKRIGLNDSFTSIIGSTEYLRKVYGLDSEAIINAVKDYIR